MPANNLTNREKATAKRKNAILESAVMCFIESGYHQTGMRDIAKRADVSLGNLYNHFGGKADILAEIAQIERAEMEPFLQLLVRQAHALDVLTEFVPAYTRYLAKPEHVILSLEITSEAIRDPLIAALFVESRQAMIEALENLLVRGASEGNMRQTQNAAETAYFLLDIMESTAFRHGIEEVPLENLLDNQWEFIAAAVAK